MCSEPRSTCCGSSRLFPVSVLVAALAPVLGCEALQPATPAEDGQVKLSPVLRRMQKAYPDLAAGRFVSVADLESPAQVGLFRTVGADGSEGDCHQPTLSILRSRNETGAGSLKAALASPDERLLLDGQRSRNLAVVRDWRPYGLFLMSIFGPPGGAVIEFTVHSGEEAPLQWTRTFHVKPDWNLYRVDVATVGDAVDLADVRALAWRVPAASAPVEFYLDDLILADNTQAVVPRTENPEHLWVQTRGQRICVGAPGRFELAFADGQIVFWRDVGTENLADIGGLGPWPIPLSDDWATRAEAPIAYDDPQHFAAWGDQVAAGQGLIEATPFRVVIEGGWRFVRNTASATTAPATPPGHTWRYAIYPNGRVHVRVRSEAGTAGWSGALVGYALGLDGRRGFECPAGLPHEPHSAPVEFVLAARRGPLRADLLWTWPAATHLPHHRMLASIDERRLALVVGAVPAAEVVETAQLLRIWPADVDGVQDARGLATDFQYPARPRASTGLVVTEVDGDLDADGYNESEGCYELELGDKVLRFELPADGRPRFDPVFRVQGTADKRCWVYARGRLVEELGRDANNMLLFRLGKLTGSAVAVEVHAAPAARQP